MQLELSQNRFSALLRFCYFLLDCHKANRLLTHRDNISIWKFSWEDRAWRYDRERGDAGILDASRRAVQASHCQAYTYNSVCVLEQLAHPSIHNNEGGNASRTPGTYAVAVRHDIAERRRSYL